MSWNFLRIFLEQKRPWKLRGRARRATRREQPTRVRLACPGGLCSPRGPSSRETDAKNPINRETIRNNPRSEVPSMQAPVATKNQSRPRSGTLSEGVIIIGGHLHHPDGHHDEEGVVHPRGWGFVPVAICLIFLSLSLVFLRWHDLDVSQALLI